MGEDVRVLGDNIDESKLPQLARMHVMWQKPTSVLEVLQVPVRPQISRPKLSGYAEYCRKNSAVGPEFFGISIDANVLYVGTSVKECLKRLTAEGWSVENNSLPVKGSGQGVFPSPVDNTASPTRYLVLGSQTKANCQKAKDERGKVGGHLQQIIST